VTIHNDLKNRRIGGSAPDGTVVPADPIAKTDTQDVIRDAGNTNDRVRDQVAGHLDATTSRQGDVGHGGARLVHHASALKAQRPPVHLDELLAFCLKSGASDLHLSPGEPPMLRLHGEMRRVNLPPLEHHDIHKLVYDVMSDAQQKTYEAKKGVDFGFDMPGHGRFRVNVLLEQGGIGAVFRVVPTKVPTLDELGAPKILAKLAELPRGLVLVTGAAGAGKSTTLAAMLEHRNATSRSHIITIEDPIEFKHDGKTSLVRQRELGEHTDTFAEALRAALREDPNVIMVGEMRDVDTIRLALTAAETGVLVLATLHTASAPKTIDRILDVFPAEEKEHARAMLSESLAAVVSQTLVPTKDGKARVAAHEIMVSNPAIRNLIRENKVAQIAALLPTQRDQGNQSLQQSLQQLVKDNVISSNEARRRGGEI
jgi:twitching motility protein PilT